MADYVVPVGWKLYSSEAHQSTYIIPGHAVDRPYLAIFSRTIASASGKGTTVPEVRVRIMRGYKNADGVLLPTRKSFDGRVRWPLEASDATEMTAILAIVGTMFSNVDFQQDVTVEQLIPRV